MRNYNKPKSTMSLFVFISTMLSILSGLLLSSHVFAANTGNMNASVNITAACSLSIAGTNFSTSVIPGNSVLIGTSTVTSICNDPSGLAVYVVGYTNDSYGNNNLTATINETTYNIPASTSAASRWNMTIKGVTGTYAPTIVTTFDNTAQPIPDQYTKVAYRNTITDIGTGATGAKFTADFNAHVDMTQPAGTYVGKVKFLLIHPNVLTYNEQTGEPATFAPDTLANDPDAPVGPDVPDDPRTDSKYLQAVALWGNTVTLNNGPIEKIDARDGQSYKVVRYKLNAAGTKTVLWMGTLNFGATESLDVAQLNFKNTNLASGVSPISASTFASWKKTVSTNSYVNPELIPITSSNSSTGSDTDSNNNKYGTLYNYAAATAGTIASQNNDDVATSSLCPAGWRLPTLSDYQEFLSANSLGANAASVVSAQTNFGFTLSGAADIWYGDNTGRPINQGNVGYFWTSTPGSWTGYGLRSALLVDNIDSFVEADSESAQPGERAQPVRCISDN